jgi:hypothetical protein
MSGELSHAHEIRRRPLGWDGEHQLGLAENLATNIEFLSITGEGISMWRLQFCGPETAVIARRLRRSPFPFHSPEPLPSNIHQNAIP